MVLWNSKPGRTSIGANPTYRDDNKERETLTTPVYPPPATEAPTVIGNSNTSSNPSTSSFGDFILKEDTVSGVKILKVVYVPNNSVIHAYQPVPT